MESKPEFLMIGEVARRAHVRVETVRFYERMGLVAKPARTASGYRKYPAQVVREVRFIQAAQGLGFSLKEIQELIVLRVTKGRGCVGVRRRAAAKLSDVEAKLGELHRIRDALAELVAACADTESSASCALLDALDEQGEHDEDR